MRARQLPADRPAPRRAGQIAQWVGSAQTYLALADGEPAGYAVLTHDFFHEDFIEMLMIGAAHRRQGIGMALVGRLAETCRGQRVWCSTNRSNLAMQSLLGRAGFTRSGIVEGLDEGDPEVIWRKNLR